MDWSIVKKKIRKVKEIKLNENIQQIIINRRLLSKKDTTLSDEEFKILQAHPRYNELKEIGDCLCCSEKIINEIIKRKFYKCYRCYCCLGDCDFDDYEVYECINNNNTYIELISRDKLLENYEEFEMYDDYKFKKHK